MITIPTDVIQPFWTQTTLLDGTAYLLEFRYNQREKCYYLCVSLPDGTPIIAAVKMVSNWRLLQSYADDRAPAGELIAVAFGPDDSPAQLGELGIGQRVELTYFTRAECVAAGKDGWRL